VLARPRNVETYTDPSGGCPFDDYMDKLKDVIGEAAIEARVTRLESGSLGEYGDIGDGLIELKIRVGPAYRIYIADDGANSLILCAGSKRTQRQDIKNAKKYWADYKVRRGQG